MKTKILSTLGALALTLFLTAGGPAGTQTTQAQGLVEYALIDTLPAIEVVAIHLNSGRLKVCTECTSHPSCDAGISINCEDEIEPYCTYCKLESCNNCSWRHMYSNYWACRAGTNNQGWPKCKCANCEYCERTVERDPDYYKAIDRLIQGQVIVAQQLIY